MLPWFNTIEKINEHQCKANMQKKKKRRRRVGVLEEGEYQEFCDWKEFDPQKDLRN